jgi:hypothetical protein
MKLKRIILIATSLVLASAGATVSGYFGLRIHQRLKSGRPDLGFVSCNHCHRVSLAKLPWAKPRPHHDAPGGIVVSPDGKTLFIALDDRDEIAEADVTSLTVIRRAKVPGGPFGLALDAAGQRLFVACPNQDRVAVLDTHDLKEQTCIAVGIRPTDVAYCQTPAGERLTSPCSRFRH